MGKNAILTGNLDSFDERILLLSQDEIIVFDEKKNETVTLPLLDALKILQENQKGKREGQRGFDKQNQILDIAPFFESLSVFHLTEKYPRLFPQDSAPKFESFLAASPIVQSHQLEALGGASRIANFSGAYSEADLIKLFSSLESRMKNIDPPQPISLLLSTGDHAITVGFDPKAQFNGKYPWVLIDANTLPTKYIDDISTLVKEVQRSAFTPLFGATILTTEIFITPNRHHMWLSTQKELDLNMLTEQDMLLQKDDKDFVLYWRENNEIKKFHLSEDRVKSLFLDKLFLENKVGLTPVKLESNPSNYTVIDQLANQCKIEHPTEKHFKETIAHWQDSEWQKIHTVTKQRAELINTHGSISWLFLAAAENELEKVNELLKHADPNLATNSDGYTSLCIAALHGNSEVVKALLSNGAEPNLATKKKETPLHLAALQGFDDIVKILLSKGADPNLETENGSTPLCIATLHGNSEVVKALLSNGADPKLGKNGITPLHLAASRGFNNIVEILLSHNNKSDSNLVSAEGWTPLCAAIDKGHTDVVKTLLSNGADPNIGKDGVTPLYLAASRGCNDIVGILLSKEVNLNLEATNRWTPLGVAIDKGHFNVVNTLLLNGAEPNQLTGGKTPLYLAASRGCNDIVEILLSKEVNLNLASTNGWTPLSVAADQGHINVVNTLLDNGADSNMASAENWTPLCAATSKGHINVIDALILKKANPNLPSAKGWTPLCVAADTGRIDVVLKLLSCGGNPNLTTEDGQTPLYLAAAKGHSETIKKLFAASADINKANKFGATPLFIAAQNGHFDAVRILLDCDADMNLSLTLEKSKLIEFAKNMKDEEILTRMEDLIKAKSTTANDKISITPEEIAKVMGQKDILNLFQLQKSLLIPTSPRLNAVQTCHTQISATDKVEERKRKLDEFITFDTQAKNAFPICKKIPLDKETVVIGEKVNKAYEQYVTDKNTEAALKLIPSPKVSFWSRLHTANDPKFPANTKNTFVKK